MQSRNLRVYCDGGARGNPGPGAAAAIIEDLAGKTRFLCGKYLSWTTNNQAEYTAVKVGLEAIKEHFDNGIDVDFFLDSKLVASQLSGLYKVKDKNLTEIFFEIRKLEIWLGKVYYHHIRREENKQADSLVNQVIDSQRDIFKQDTEL